LHHLPSTENITPKRELRGNSLFDFGFVLQPIEASNITEKSLKVPLCGTFKLFSGFHVSAKRCNTTDYRYTK
jgi:hypothetical protein